MHQVVFVAVSTLLLATAGANAQRALTIDEKLDVVLQRLENTNASISALNATIVRIEDRIQSLVSHSTTSERRCDQLTQDLKDLNRALKSLEDDLAARANR